MSGKKTVPISQALQAAVKHVKTGHLQQAEHICRQIVSADPENAAANHLLGVVALQSNKYDTAVQLITRAAAKNPHDSAMYINQGSAYRALGRQDEAVDSYKQALNIKDDNPLAHNNLGAILKAQGKMDEAIDSFMQAIKYKPDYAEAHYNLGNAFVELKRPDEAAESFNRALEIVPGYAEALHNLGYVHKSQKKFDEAEKSIRLAIKIKQDNAEMHNSLGIVLHSQGKLAEAVSSYEQAVKLKPDYAESYYNLGRVFREQGLLDEAISFFKRAITVNPDFVLAYNNLGNILHEQNKPDEALEFLNRALEIKPDFVEAHNNLGNVLKAQGNIAEAVASYNRALEIQPDFVDAYRQLAHARKYTEYNDEIRAMETLLQDDSMNDLQKMHLNFGLGKAYEDLGEYEKAFSCIQVANRLKRDTFEYAMSEDRVFINNIKKTFDEKFILEHTGAGCNSGTPIFIVGMPRSGTSLVEQILSSHPLVHGAGELGYMRSMLLKYCSKKVEPEIPDCIKKFGKNDFKKFGSAYVDKIRLHSQDAKYITDKMPHNFLNIGLIKLVLPNAKIIHCQRNPMDTCFSNFKNFFTGTHKYAYDLQELGEYYKLYDQLMEYWHKILPGFIYDIQYEELVADQENQTRRLLEYCGLDWDDRCLSFHKSNRTVRTASSTQVRQPIYNDSVQLWKQYEKQLEPLLQALDYSE
jgi:tetratricopeptide (TPR) repeat protein